MGLDYVDIFYSHRFDPDTPLEETLGALDSAVRQGKALYAGISSYSAERTREAAAIMRELGTPVLIHQPSYSLLNRWIEPELLDVLGDEGIGCIVFSPLGQGMLTEKYLDGIPEDSRAAEDRFLKRDFLTEENLARVRALAEIARGRGQSLAQLAIAWTLRDARITSALIGASSVEQLEQNVAALEKLELVGRRARGDRPPRRRLRDQPVGGVERGVTARGDFPHIHRITTRWDDNDVYGHVNNVRYFAFFDTAINEWLVRAGGLDIHAGDVIGLCAESHCEYSAPLAFPGRRRGGAARRPRRQLERALRARRVPGRRRRAGGDRLVRARVRRPGDAPPGALPAGPARGAGRDQLKETVFTLEVTPVKFGPGAADDAGWESGHRFIPHGQSVIVTAPAAFLRASL